MRHFEQYQRSSVDSTLAVSRDAGHCTRIGGGTSPIAMERIAPENQSETETIPVNRTTINSGDVNGDFIEISPHKVL